MKRIKIGNVVMCEFIAEGVNNKHTLSNTISGDLILSEFPAQISVAFYIEIIPTETEIINFDLAIFLGKRRAAKAGGDLTFEKTKSALLLLPNSIVQVDGPSDIRLVLRLGGGPSKTLMKKRILRAQGVSH